MVDLEMLHMDNNSQEQATMIIERIKPFTSYIPSLTREQLSAWPADS
jgi:hypothetical protein